MTFWGVNECACYLLQHVYALRGGGLVKAPHVVVHLWKTLLHVILCTALPNCPETEAHGGVMQLWRQQGVVDDDDDDGGDEERMKYQIHCSKLPT